MDRYDEYQAMNSAGSGTSSRMNKLKAYMALYSQSGMGGALAADQVIGPSMGSSGARNYNVTPGAGANNAMNWATVQLDNESRQEAQNQRTPNFYGQQEQYTQPPLQQNQYIQPQMSQEQNPYGGSDVTNYLRRLMDGRMSGSRVGTKGLRG